MCTYKTFIKTYGRIFLMTNKKFNVYSFDGYYEGYSPNAEIPNEEIPPYTLLRDWVKDFFNQGLDSYSKEELAYTIFQLWNADLETFALYDDSDVEELRVFIEKSLAKIESFLGEEKFKDYLDNAEEISVILKNQTDKMMGIEQTVTSDNFEIIMKLVGVTVTVLFIIMIIMQYVKESNCESVTYYEYGVKKTGQVCDDSAKYQLRNNIDETKK